MEMGPSILSGEILCYRIFDIADEIDLGKAQRALAQDARRLKLSRQGSEYLQFPNPPLAIDFGRRALKLRDQTVEARVFARLFDHGAGSVILHVPIAEGTSVEALVPIADELYDSHSVDEVAKEVIQRLRKDVAAALQGTHLWEQSESYTIVFVNRLTGDPTAAALLEQVDLARLLLGEHSQKLSKRERQDVTGHAFSYTESDLVVVDWNSAFVYEPSGSMDIPDVLEMANAQLLEFRYYDELLDKSIQGVHQALEARRASWTSIFRSPYRKLARRVLITLFEMSEFIERVENSLKIIGDFYLAKVYEGGLRRLRVPQWQASVTRKQQMLTHTYQLLKGEVDTDRALTLEITIVVLIVSELFLALAQLLK